ncbi:O-methyltransferase [Planctomycetota bacterium]
MSEPIETVVPTVKAYLEGFLSAPDELLARLEAEARAERIPIVPPETGAFLELLTRATKPERVLEVGTAIGYSTIRMARALPPWGNLDTIEVDPEVADRAQRSITEAGLQKVVRVYRGAALELIPALQNRYDMVFLDAAKTEYEGYLTLSLGLMPQGAVVVVDNLLWGGRVVAGDFEDDPQWRREDTAALQRFNEHFCNHPQLVAQILPVGDGIGVAVKV